jgi:stage III sporulation protein AF
MQSLISSWAIAVTVAVIFSSIVSSLLPETSIKKYITIVLGVVVTIIILSPLFKLFEGTGYQKEIDNALDSISTQKSDTYDGSSYLDYIYKTYNIPKSK